MSIAAFNFGPKNPLFSFGNCGSKDVFHFEETTNTPYIRAWSSKVKYLPDFGARSAIFEDLVNSLLNDGREDQAEYFIEAFYYLPPDEINCVYNNAMVALEALEACTPKVAYRVIGEKLVSCVSDAVLSSSICKNSDEIATELWDVLDGLIKQFNPGANEAKAKQRKGKKKNPIVLEKEKEVKEVVSTEVTVIGSETTTNQVVASKADDVTDVVAKTKEKVVFVINAKMFPTKQGSPEHKKRLHEARNHFSQTVNHESLIDFISDQIDLSAKFMVRNLGVEKIIEVYATAPESVTFEETKFGVLHKLCVLFLNTEIGNDDALNDKAVSFALMSEWTSLKNEKEKKPGKEEQEVLERMNLAQAGQVASKK